MRYFVIKYTTDIKEKGLWYQKTVKGEDILDAILEFIIKGNISHEKIFNIEETYKQKYLDKGLYDGKENNEKTRTAK